MCSSDAKAARRKSAASAMLPRIFDTLRAMYGATGPATKLYDEVSSTRIACMWVCYLKKSGQLHQVTMK